MCDYLWPHVMQHTRLPCLSPVCSNSYPLSQWYHPIFLSPGTPFSCLQSFPSSGSFPKSQVFTSGGPSIRASAWASVFPVKIQGWFPLVLTGFISLMSKELSRVFSNTKVRNHRFFDAQHSFWYNSQNCTWLLENHNFDYMDPCQQSDVSAF